MTKITNTKNLVLEFEILINSWIYAFYNQGDTRCYQKR
jgi:hypothetical protein